MIVNVAGVSFYTGNIEKLLKPNGDYYLPDKMLIRKIGKGIVAKYHDCYCEFGEIVPTTEGQLFSGGLKLLIKGKVIGSIAKEQKQEVLDYTKSLQGNYFVRVWINCNRIKEIVNDEVIVRDFNYHVKAEIVSGKPSYDRMVYIFDNGEHRKIT